MNDKIKIDNVLYETNLDRTGDHPFIIFNTKRKYFKFCSECGKIQLYGLKTDLIRRIKNNSICFGCRINTGCHHPMSGHYHSEESKKIMSIKKMGNCISQDARKKISEKAKKRFLVKKNHPMFGKTHSDKSKRIMSEKAKISMSDSTKNPMYGKHQSIERKIQQSKYMIERHSKELEHPSKRPEVRQKIRESILKRVKLLGNGGYNPKACEYIDLLNKQNGWELRHAMNGGEIVCIGYSLDGYDKKRNIVVEYDEPRHYKMSGELKDKDVRRMDEIINYLGCKFYRYDERNKLLNKIN